MSDYIVGNVSNLIIQYGQKSNAVATVTAYSEEFELIYDNANILQMAYDLDFAVGKQLDIIGKIVGISRNVPFSVPKKYFGFDGHLNAYPFGSKFNVVVSYSFRSKFEITYSDGQLNDNDYSFFIKAKIIKNYATSKNIDSSNLSIQNAVDYLFNSKAYIVDNKDMTMTLYIDSSYDSSKLIYLENLDLLPRPQGVRYNTFISYQDGITFGFNSFNAGLGSKFAISEPSRFAYKII